jgi:phage-related holin
MKFLQAMLVSLAAVLAPIKAILLVTGFLIIADLISGVLAARKRGEAISSAGLRRTITKCLVYNLAVISGFLVEQYMLSSLFPISKLIAGIISLVELKSILENLNTINGSDIFKTVLAQLGSVNDKTKSGDSKEPPK